MSAHRFLNEMKGVSIPNVFNPYRDCCDVYDLADAPMRRSRALKHMLNAAVALEVDSLWIGRDLGHRGGRRTGLALTDDVHFESHVSRWEVSAERPTKGSFIAERTAAIVWSLLENIDARVFLWNVFPFHPHDPQDPFTNRAHTRSERAVGEALLEELIRLLKPRQIVAIGNDAAESALRICSIEKVAKVRHPSYGGQRDFIAQIGKLYGSLPANAAPTFWT